MARRLPGIRGRMEHAAVELFAEQGYAATTAAQIAARAGTTERTFFRHFHEKADAAFGVELDIQHEFVTGALNARAEDSAWQATCSGFASAAALIAQDPAGFRARAAVVAANPELQARELARAGAWTEVITRTLGQRGVEERDATTCAAVGLVLFRLALLSWAAAPGTQLSDALESAWRTAALQLQSGRTRTR